MTGREILAAITAELAARAAEVDDDAFARLGDALAAPGRVYVAGAGRSGLVMRAFANRLMHLGRTAFVVGDITTPHTAPGDLLVVGSGSGETPSVVEVARRAREAGVRVAALTLAPASTLADLADVPLVLPGASPKLRDDTARRASDQPGASGFEQLLWLTCDALVIALRARTGMTDADLMARHADLE